MRADNEHSLALMEMNRSQILKLSECLINFNWQHMLAIFLVYNPI